MASGEVAEVRTYGSMMSADMAANTAHVASASSTQVPTVRLALRVLARHVSAQADTGADGQRHNDELERVDDRKRGQGVI